MKFKLPRPVRQPTIKSLFFVTAVVAAFAAMARAFAVKYMPIFWHDAFIWTAIFWAIPITLTMFVRSRVLLSSVVCNIYLITIYLTDDEYQLTYFYDSSITSGMKQPAYLLLGSIYGSDIHYVPSHHIHICGVLMYVAFALIFSYTCREIPSEILPASEPKIDSTTHGQEPK